MPTKPKRPKPVSIRVSEQTRDLLRQYVGPKGLKMSYLADELICNGIELRKKEDRRNGNV